MPQRERLPREADWVDRIRSGDRAAFEELFRAYYEPLCLFVEGYVGSVDATRELVQDMFVRIWEKRHDWLLRGSVKSYLYTAARNRALNRLRDERARRRLTEERVWMGSRSVPPGMAQQPAGADLRVEAEELETAIREAVAALPERYRRIFELRSQQNLTHGEIASILQLPVKTVETRSRRALQLLRTRLERFFQ